MLRLAIIGYPLGHSLSPVMHNAALKELGIEGSYIVLETPPEQLAEKIDFLKDNDFRGFNVTIPHKTEVIKYLDSVDDAAKIVGAVNTVVIDENKKLHGYNTDVYGFVEAIPPELRKSGLRAEAEEAPKPLRNAVHPEQPGRAAVLGSGGAARAVLAGLIQIGIKEISIFARNTEKALELKEFVLKNFSKLSFSESEANVRIYPACNFTHNQNGQILTAATQPEDDNKTIKINCDLLNENIDLSGFSIVVNTTPLGMKGKNEDFSPLSEKSVESLPEDAVVYDIVYNPLKTRLLEYAEKKGLKTINGLEMLVLQGAKGFELWTGQKPPVSVMRNSLTG